MMKQENESEIEMFLQEADGDDGGGAEGGVEEQLIPGTSMGNNDAAAKKRSAKFGGSSSPGEGGEAKDSAAKRKLRKKKAEESSTAVLIKYAALFLLVAQMVGLVLLMRYSRTSNSANEPLYLASTAVFIMEVMKLVICCVVIAVQSGGALLAELNTHVLQAPMELLKLCVPSLLYTIQNNLLYLALTNLDPATYQVCYQLKILTTALFSAILLQRKFSITKWFSLILLTIGVAIVQISGTRDATVSVGEQHNRFVGLVAVLCAACTSGFSGVYFEKILKGSTTSLWLRNVQMGLPSVIIAFMTIYLKDSAAVEEMGFLGGFTPLVWTVVTVQAAGGLIVAVVVKYADNVLKVFATSFSIVISCIISALFFDFHATMAFMVGAGLVVLATVLYSQPEKKRTRRKPVLPMTNSMTNSSIK